MRLRTHAGFRLFRTASAVSDFGTPITTLAGPFRTVRWRRGGNT